MILNMTHMEQNQTYSNSDYFVVAIIKVEKGARAWK